MSFARRHINLTFTLASGATFDGKNDTVTVEGLRCSVTINKAGGASMVQATLRVYGMPLDTMNKLTILGKQLDWNRRNTVAISAGDDDSGMSVVFVGIMTEAWVDANASPDVAFTAVAFSNLMSAVTPIAPTSYKGTVDVATVLSGICAQMQPPLRLENNGVVTQISNGYWPGTLLDQAQAIQRTADFEWSIDHDTMAIWPRGGTRGTVIPLLSAGTGLVGYPTYTDQGLQVRTLYNPGIFYGGQIQIESTLTPANGKWVVYNIIHDLESETPGGRWFTTIETSLLGVELSVAR